MLIQNKLVEVKKMLTGVSAIGTFRASIVPHK